MKILCFKRGANKLQVDSIFSETCTWLLYLENGWGFVIAFGFWGSKRESRGERKSYRGRESGRKTIPTTCSLLKRLHSPELNPCIPCSWRGSKYSMTTSGPQSAYYTKKLEQGTKPGLQFRQSNTDGASTAQSNDCSLKS